MRTTAQPMTLIQHGFNADLPLPVLAPEAEDTRKWYLDEAAKVRLCTNPEEAAVVSDTARSLASHLRHVDAVEMSLRRDPNAWLAALREVRNEYSAPLLLELKRLQALASDFAAAERRRVAEAERVRQIEIQRLEQERREAEARLNAAQAKLNTPKQLEKAIQAEEAVAKASAAAQEAIRAPLPSVSRVAGMPIKRVMDYKVLDVKAMYAQRPELCHLIENKAAIRACVVPRFPHESEEVDTLTVPGLELRWIDQVSTRVNR